MERAAGRHGLTYRLPPAEGAFAESGAALLAPGLRGLSGCTAARNPHGVQDIYFTFTSLYNFYK